MNYRTEHDSMGEILVPSDRYWGAQTQRSLENFPIGEEKMPVAIVRAFGYLKKAAAQANATLCPTRMTAERASAICRACCTVSVRRSVSRVQMRSLAMQSSAVRSSANRAISQRLIGDAPFR